MYVIQDYFKSYKYKYQNITVVESLMSLRNIKFYINITTNVVDLFYGFKFNFKFVLNFCYFFFVIFANFLDFKI